jgi:hypothetical protein
MNLLPSHCIEHIAGMTDVEHLRMMWCVCCGFRAALMDSWHSWTMVGRRVCGDEWWDGALPSSSLLKNENASQFARRVICPWLMTPRFMDVFPPSIWSKLAVQDEPGEQPRSRAWRIQMNDDEATLIVDSQTSTPMRAFLFRDVDLRSNNDRFRVTFTIPARSAADDGSVYGGPGEFSKQHDSSSSRSKKVDQAFVEHLRTCKPELTLTRRMYRRDTTTIFTEQDIKTVLNFWFHDRHEIIMSDISSRSCWYLHAGVVVASFSCSRLATPIHVGGAGGLGFLSVRTGKLLHFLPLTEEIGASDLLWVARPGEMWVLEKWANRVLYFGQNW